MIRRSHAVSALLLTVVVLSFQNCRFVPKEAASLASSSNDSELVTPSGDGKKVTPPPFKDLELIDVTGNCNGIKARFRNGSEFLGFELADPCRQVNFSNGIKASVQSIYSQASTLGTWSVLDSPTGGYSQVTTTGDCRSMLVEFRDEYLNLNYAYTIHAPCDKIDFSNKAGAAKLVLNYLKSLGLKPVANSKTSLDASCDHNVTPANYQTVIAQIPKESSEWRNVCFAGGVYSSPLFLTGYKNLRFTGTGAGTAFNALVYYDPPNPNSDPSGVIDLRQSTNFVLQSMSIRNQVTYDQSGTLHMQTSRAFGTNYGNGVTLRDLQVYSGGKLTISLNDGINRLFDSSVYGGYALIDANRSTNFILNVGFEVYIPGEDSHPALGGYNSDGFYRNITLKQHTGAAVIGLINSDLSYLTVIENFSALTPVKAWIQKLKPNGRDLSNARLALLGSNTLLPDRCYWPENIGADIEIDNAEVAPSNPAAYVPCR